MTETGASFAGRKKFEGPGGTPGGVVEVLVGLLMIGIGIYIVFDHVTVHTSFWRFFGGPGTSFGMTLLPLLGGIGVLFFNGRSMLGWVLTVGGHRPDPDRRADEHGHLLPAHQPVGDDHDVRADRRPVSVCSRAACGLTFGSDGASKAATLRATSKGASMLRCSVPCSGWLSVSCGPTVAFAQQPGQGPPMPIAVDLAKVPVGSWADYTMTMGQLPPMKMRMALVAKNAGRQHRSRRRSKAG